MGRNDLPTFRDHFSLRDYNTDRPSAIRLVRHFYFHVRLLHALPGRRTVVKTAYTEVSFCFFRSYPEQVLESTRDVCFEESRGLLQRVHLIGVYPEAAIKRLIEVRIQVAHEFL